MIPALPVATRRVSALLRSLRHGVEADLSGVRLLFVHNLPADGLACGNTIMLSSSLLERDPDELLHAAVHEITHVFQQRSGCVIPANDVGSVSISIAPDLEEEAEGNARHVLNGGRIKLRGAKQPASNRVVLQPLLSVGGHPRADAKALSDHFTRILPLIPQGPFWLDWVLSSSTPMHCFADEATLLSAIVLGLHGTADVCFQGAGLRLAPALLLSLEDPDFSNVVGSLETGQLTPAALQVLKSQQVCTAADLSALRAWLDQLGLSAALPLSTPTLAEQVAMHAQFIAGPLPQSASPPAIAAAQFAAVHGQTATDFAAAYEFHLAVTSAKTKSNLSPEDVWTGLSPLSFPYLDCPACDPFSADSDLASLIVRQLRRAGFIGFMSQAVAISAFARDAGLTLTKKVSADSEELVRTYMLGLSKFANPLSEGGCSEPRITRLQDGLTRWIDYSSAAGTARLQLDPTGLLTLRRFSPSPAPEA